MTSNLFREEVFAAKRIQWLGTIRLGRPLSFSLVTTIALALAVALIAFAMWGQVSRKARLPGLLIPVDGTLNLAADQAGVMLELSAKEGDSVRSGQTVAVISTDRATQQGALASLVGRSLAERRASLELERQLMQRHARERGDALLARLRSTEAERQQAARELDTAGRRVKLGLKTVERYQQLAENGFVADVQVQQKQEELLDIQAREQSTQRALATLERDAIALKSELDANATELATQMAQVDRSLAVLDQEAAENMARGRIAVIAPQDAVVSAVSSYVGQAVQPGRTLLTLVPRRGEHASALEAHLYAPSRLAGFVQAGQQVWLRLAAYPYQKFGMVNGVITSVSQTPINAQDLPQGQAQALSEAARTTEPMFRVTVKLGNQHILAYGGKQALKAGMSLEADVMQDRRAVWEWVLEPVLATSGYTSLLGSSKPSPGQQH